MEMIRTVPTEKLEEIELEAELTGNYEASELAGQELDRRSREKLSRLAILRAMIEE